MTELLQRYIEQHSDPEGDYLHRLWRATHLHTLHGRMVSGHVEGRLLKMLVTMIRPKHILEIRPSRDIALSAWPRDCVR